MVKKELKKNDCSSNKEIIGKIEGLTLKYPDKIEKNAKEVLESLEVPFKNN